MPRHSTQPTPQPRTPTTPTTTTSPRDRSIPPGQQHRRPRPTEPLPRTRQRAGSPISVCCCRALATLRRYRSGRDSEQRRYHQPLPEGLPTSRRGHCFVAMPRHPGRRHPQQQQQEQQPLAAATLKNVSPKKCKSRKAKRQHKTHGGQRQRVQPEHAQRVDGSGCGASGQTGPNQHLAAGAAHRHTARRSQRASMPTRMPILSSAALAEAGVRRVDGCVAVRAFTGGCPRCRIRLWCLRVCRCRCSPPLR